MMIVVVSFYVGNLMRKSESNLIRWEEKGGGGRGGEGRRKENQKRHE
jgi:hypothetical protein